MQHGGGSSPSAGVVVSHAPTDGPVLQARLWAHRCCPVSERSHGCPVYGDPMKNLC